MWKALKDTTVDFVGCHGIERQDVLVDLKQPKFQWTMFARLDVKCGQLEPINHFES